MKPAKASTTLRFTSRYGPWAVITGASDGIGREIARSAAARGANVVLIARRRDRLEDLGRELESAHGIQTRILAIDLNRADGVDTVVRETDGLDVGLLAAGAGFGTSGPFVETPIEDERAMLDLNCGAVLSLTHHFARRFVARGRGGIVLLSSIVAFQGVPRAAHYAATKAWVQTLAEGLRQELGPRGVDVLASAPGPVASGFGERANMRMGAALTPQQVGSATLDALGRRTTVRPGWLSKVLGYSLATLPRAGRTRIMKAVMGGMTQHQEEEKNKTPGMSPSGRRQAS